ncbi:MAG: HD domain-containing protein [Nitrospirae bacterium]|nr:HD domain-containing protein [Nitrospirota bacterium]
MIGNIKIRLSDLIVSFSRALDFINPAVTNHHLRVAIIASEIAKEIGLDRQEINDIFLASTIHDIGAFSLRDRLATLEFEIKDPYQHSEKGYLLVKNFDLFSKISRIIRYHHVPWAEGEGQYFNGEDVPVGGHIIHLADRIEVLINKHQEVLNQSKSIVDIIKPQSNKKFMPELVKAFENVAVKEYFWLDAASPEIDQIISDRNVLPDMELDIKGLMGIAVIFSHIIDYRSQFTAVHSAGVSAVATALAQMSGFSDIECKMMQAAGHLHDIGKLAVPLEILDKPAGLSAAEFNIIKSHVYHSYRILEKTAGLDTINTWGSLHHERMDGTGYPFHLKGSELSIGSRIMAVADVFTAITEDRPYRKGMDGKNALRIIENMAKDNALDHSIVGIASSYFKHLDDMRIEAQNNARAGYLSVKQFIE